MLNRIVLCLILSIFLMPLSHGSADEDFEAAKKLFLNQDYKKAINHLKETTEKDPSNIDAWFLLGDCYKARKKDKKAIAAYAKVLEIDPENQAALLSLGMSYMDKKNYTEAISSFKKLIEMNPTHTEAHFYLGVTYDRVNRLSSAFAQYKILKTLDGELAEKLYHIIFW